MLKYAFIFLYVSTSLFAEVRLIEKGDRSIRISHPRKAPWKMEEEVCVVRMEEVVGCGRVMDRTPQFADIDTGDFTSDIQEGDHLQSYRDIQDKLKRFQITPGLEAGLGYYFPTIELQVRASGQWFIGLLGSYSSSQDSGFSISQKGIMLSANHYSLLDPFPGFWFRIGAGAYFLSVSNTKEETVTTPFVLSTIGWRGQFLDYATLGIGIGAQYLPNRVQSTNLGLRELEPVATIDIGIKW